MRSQRRPHFQVATVADINTDALDPPASSRVANHHFDSEKVLEVQGTNGAPEATTRGQGAAATKSCHYKVGLELY